LKSIKVIFLFLLLISLIGCQSENMLLAKKLLEHNQEKYKDLPATGEIVNGVRVIKIEAYQFYFKPEVIIVNKGDKVKLVVEAMDIPHGFEIEGFHIPDYDTNTVIRPGNPLTLEFLADQEGWWEIICSIYCGFGHSKMKGEFIIR
jgi:cytochrome c oxidase subunit II